MSEVRIKQIDNLTSRYHFDSGSDCRAALFWNYCAEEQHQNKLHRVYVLHLLEEDEIAAFFSLAANSIVVRLEGEKQPIHLPFLDVPFISIATHFSDNDEIQEQLCRLLIESIIYISKDISEKIGCRYIRCYSPILALTKEIDKEETREHLYRCLPNLYEEYGFITPLKTGDSYFREKLRKNNVSHSFRKNQHNIPECRSKVPYILLIFYYRDLNK